MQKSEMDKAWNAIFKKYDILSAIDHDGSVTIKSSLMKDFREPRLLAKQDHDYDRPEIFKKHYLTILPLSRTEYTIGHMSLYYTLNIKWENHDNIIEIERPENTDTIDFDNINSEAIAINSAHVAGIFNHFFETDHLMPSGANGRMGSGSFDFVIDNLLDDNDPYFIKIQNAQMEIDAGFETNDSLFIIEAKNSLSHDFLIRQLYYPYRFWSNKTSKTVKPVFLFFNEGIYHLLLLSFTDLQHYNSIKIEKYQKYRIINNKVAFIEKEAMKNKVKEDSTIPFPQADSMDKVIAICQKLYEKKSEVGGFDLLFYMRNTYGKFTGRQIQYYTNAARYLKLIERSRPGYYKLTPIGNKIFQLSDVKARNRMIAIQVLCHSIFLACYRHRIGQNKHLNTADYIHVMTFHPDCNLEGEMLKRRARTLTCWIDWIMDIDKN